MHIPCHPQKYVLTLLMLLTAASKLYGTAFGTPIAMGEAEEGQLLGVQVESSESGFTGSGYVTGFDNDGDQVSIPIVVPEAGTYRLAIRYSNSSDKSQKVSINGEFSFPVDFPNQAGFALADAGSHPFHQGENTVSIIKDWGWTHIDRVEIHEATDLAFDIAAAPIDPLADAASVELYQMLMLQFGHRIISGQTDSHFEELSNTAGNTPMLRVGDFSSYTEGYAYLWSGGGHTLGKDPNGISEKLIQWHQEQEGKALISFQWHWHSPSGAPAGQNNFYTENTSFDIREAVTPGTQEYSDIIRDIDDIAVELAKFRDAGIPVLWRPLHEAGGGWFWWGAHGPEPCLALWDIIQDRMIHEHGLHNLLWVWSTPEEDWYPGNHKVDVVGHDSYPGYFNYGNQKRSFDHLKALSQGKKLIAMSENGPIPHPDACLDEGAPWLFFMSWADLVESQNSQEHLREVFSHPDVVSLESADKLRTSSSWRSSLYPEHWKAGYQDSQGRFLHDFSHAGYHGGTKAVPLLSENMVDVTQAPYLADPSGVTDATAAIQQALDHVGSQGGGVVYLPPGTYRILPAPGQDHALEISHSHTILRGAGPEQTFLFNDSDQMRQKEVIYVAPAWASWFSSGGNSTRIRQDLDLPTRIIPMESVEGFRVGDEVIVLNTPTEGFIAEHGMTGLWNTSIKGVAFKRRIDSIDQARQLLVLDTPTRYGLKTRDVARVHLAKPHLEEIGLEDFSIGNRESPLSGWGEEDFNTPGTGAYDAHFSHAIKFEYVQDSWVRGLQSYRPEVNSQDVHLLSNCLLLNMCRHMTVDSCHFQKPQYEGGGGNGYMYTLHANDCLISACRATHSRHNYDFKYPFSNGNVIHGCLAEDSKYSSDFHMYLSMANLFDQTTVNQDWLESKFRPYGNPIHGHPSTQSVFYNTRGEAYHSKRDYIVESRQYQWGYVIGTSGPADQVKTDPVAGTSNGYDYDSSPRDFVEGVGQGEDLEPQSLYLDQLQRRMEGPEEAQSYEVEFRVLNAHSGAPIEDCIIGIYEEEQSSDSDGRASFSEVPESFFLEVSHERYHPLASRQVLIYSDTLLSLRLTENTFALEFELLDEANLSPLAHVSITVEEESRSTDMQGLATFELYAGTHAYAFHKPSYAPVSGQIMLQSDSLLSFLLHRTHADVKIRLREGSTPVNKALVMVDEDTLVSSSLGLAKFSQLPVEEEYRYKVHLEGYEPREGSFLLLSDTTIDVSMAKVGTGLNLPLDRAIRLWPNPARDWLELAFVEGYTNLQVTDLSGRTQLSQAISGSAAKVRVSQLEEGYYLLILQGEAERIVLPFARQP